MHYHHMCLCTVGRGTKKKLGWMRREKLSFPCFPPNPVIPSRRLVLSIVTLPQYPHLHSTPPAHRSSCCTVRATADA